MDAELIKEREIEYKTQAFKEVQKDLLQVKLQVQVKKKKKKKKSLLSKSLPSKPKTCDTADHQLIEQLSPAILRFLQLESRSLVKSRGKATPMKALVLREVSVSRQAVGQAVKQLKSKATDQVMGLGSGYRKGQTGKSTSLALRQQAGRQAASPTAGQAKEQPLNDQSPRELVRQTQSGRISVKRVVFEAGRN